jgi:hypothetical protein
MTDNNKPEWFRIIDKDEKPELRRVSKSIPVSAVMVTALILGVGAVMGQTQNDTPASATSTSQSQSQSPQITANPSTAATAVIGGIAANKLANPSIARFATGGEDEYEDDDYEGNDDYEDEDD